MMTLKQSSFQFCVKDRLHINIYSCLNYHNKLQSALIQIYISLMIVTYPGMGGIQDTFCALHCLKFGKYMFNTMSKSALSLLKSDLKNCDMYGNEIFNKTIKCLSNRKDYVSPIQKMHE